MRRFHLWFSLASLIALMLGTAYQFNNTFMWLASTELFAQILRGVLIAVVVAQIITLPPRHIALRAATGFTALAAALYGINALFAPHSPVVDSFVFLQTAIGLGISALEYNPKEEQTPIILRRTPVSVPVSIDK
jgi:peptidoglycan/LPS O-acetylase OafA/YrhL